jgi:hypothetical protein
MCGHCRDGATGQEASHQFDGSDGTGVARVLGNNQCTTTSFRLHVKILRIPNDSEHLSLLTGQSVTGSFSIGTYR